MQEEQEQQVERESKVVAVIERPPLFAETIPYTHVKERNRTLWPQARPLTQKKKEKNRIKTNA